VSRAHEKRTVRADIAVLAWALSAVALGACGGGDDGDDGNGKGDSGTVQDAGTDAARSDAGDDASAPSDAGGDAGRDAAVDAGNNVPPTLTTVTARQVGRNGADLRVEVTGSDTNRNIAAVSVTLFDNAATPAMIGTERILPLATAISAAQGSSYVVLSNALNGVTNFGSARVALVDATDLRSSTVDATVAMQTVLGMGATCDATFVMNRCPTGLGCKKSSGETNTTCKAGDAPLLGNAGYYDDELGRRILFEGSDPDGDPTAYVIKFYSDAAGTVPKPVDVDGDEETAPVAEFTNTVPPLTGDGTSFFYNYQPGQQFVVDVAAVRLVVRDSGQRTSNEKLIVLAKAPTKNNNGACDPRGFDRCCAETYATQTGDFTAGSCKAPGALVCAPTSATQGTCRTSAVARSNACTAASSAGLVLRPQNGVTSVRGSVRGSVWEPPVGCSTTSAQPDTVVKLDLTAPAAKVTISTDNPSTAFDSELYVVRDCGELPLLCDPRDPRSTNAETAGWCASSPQDFWCLADPTSGAQNPVLELRNLEAGDYFIVVDSHPSTNATGDTFQLTATVE